MTGEFYEEKRNDTKSRVDRYRNCKILTDRESSEVLLSTREIDSIPYSQDDIYHSVKSHEVTRLDILAEMYYKNPLLWWLIAQANNIYDPFLPLEPGSLIRIPSIMTLYGNRGILL